jgi:hypothetical protein
VATALVIVASLGGYGWYQGLIGNITTAQVDTDEWDRPTSVEGVMNLLIIGSDVRSGENEGYGDAEGERTYKHILHSYRVNRSRTDKCLTPTRVTIPFQTNLGSADKN